MPPGFRRAQPYQWQHSAPAQPRAPRIYEAHVGMSSPEPKINTYRAFADDVLPRIAAGGYNSAPLGPSTLTS